MKHIFIINPIAGGSNQTDILTKEIKAVFQENADDYLIYVTKEPGDGEQYIKNILKESKEAMTFYACGGDGTTFEVVNGIIGYPNAHLGIIAIGSCNDYLKNFPGYDFRTIEKAISGKQVLVDSVLVNDRHMINVANIGFDARANAQCSVYKKRIKNIKVAYNLAILKNLLSKMPRKIQIDANKEEIFNGKILLMTIASGSYYGGGYKCAPRAIVDDGLLEITIVKSISRLKFINMIKTYKTGKHLESPKLKDIIIYQRAKSAYLKADKPFEICIDGENYRWNEVNFEVKHQSISLILPRI